VASAALAHLADDLDHLAGGGLQVVVDHGGVELGLGGELVGGLGEAAADLLVGLGGAAVPAPRGSAA
jgi:hypothetical protein